MCPLGLTFYGLTSKAAPLIRKNLFKEVNEIVFHGKGGYDWDTIYNMLGQKVKVLENAYLAGGTHTYTWNGQDELGQSVSTGVYLYTLTSGNQTISKKMALMK